MNREGSSVLLTTHNIEEANALCSTISVIHKGRIIAAGSPEKIRKKFDTAGFIEVSFERPVDAGIFLKDGIKRVEQIGDKWRFYTDDADPAVKAIAIIAYRNNLKILTIATSNPTLEEAFIRMTEYD
jgi:ABC-type multidrug transport system ATPase subunit